jgi:hypothetical protein
MHKVRVTDSRCPNHCGKTTAIIIYEFNNQAVYDRNKYCILNCYGQGNKSSKIRWRLLDTILVWYANDHKATLCILAV